jgi:predicted amidohydrolase YtcJ
MLGDCQGGKPVELIVEDAEFVTMAPARSAESMLVRGGRIAAIGPAAAVRAAAGRGAAVVRLNGATVIPGLIDAHCHVMNVGYLAAGADCSQPAAPGIAAVQARLREAADRTPAGSWVMGSGYVEYKLAEHRHPTRVSPAGPSAAPVWRPGRLSGRAHEQCTFQPGAAR